MVIKTFRHRGLRRAHQRRDFRKVHTTHAKKIAIILSDLDAARKLSSLDLPHYQLHPLKGDLEGIWSIRVSHNWRITFRFEAGHAYEVNLIDYH